MAAELQVFPAGNAEVAPLRLPPVPWRDPHTVSPARLSEYIGMLEELWRQNPQSADLRTCLGMAYAVNFEAYKSMHALEAAVGVEPQNSYAQLKYSELLNRLRALPRAEQETLRIDLAASQWEVSLARKQLLEIRRLIRSPRGPNPSRCWP